MKHRSPNNANQFTHSLIIISVTVLAAAVLAFSLVILDHLDQRFTDLNFAGSVPYRVLLLYISGTEDAGTDSKTQMQEINRIAERLRATFPEAVAKTDPARRAFESEMASNSRPGLETALRFRAAADTLRLDIANSALRYTRRTRYAVFAGLLFVGVLLFVELRGGRALASAEAALRASEHRFATFIEKGPAICSVKDENGAYVYINQQLANQFGTRQEDWIGRTDLELFPEEVARTLKENDLAVLKSGATSVVTEVAPALNGNKAYWLSYKFRLRDEAGRSYVGGMSINVTEQKRMEAQLGVSSEHYRDLIENASDLIQSVSPDGHFVFVNRAWRETLGYSEVELNGLSFFSVVDEDRQEECRDMFHQVFAGKTGVRIETVFVASDNCKISVEGTSDCEVEGGQVVSVRSIFRDITKRKQAEAEREKLLQELEATIASVKKLGAL